MRWIVKSIFCSRVSLIVLTILLGAQMVGMMSVLDQSEGVEQNIAQMDHTIQEAKAERSMVSLLEKQGAESGDVEDFLNYLDWKTENAKAGRALFVEHGEEVWLDPALEAEYEDISLWNTLFEMDRYAPDEEALSAHVFAKELEKVNRPPIPFAPEKIGQTGRQIVDEADGQYATLKKIAARQLHERMFPKARMPAKGAWIFLVRQLQTGSLISFVIPVLALFFSIQIGLEFRRSGALELMRLHTKGWVIQWIGCVFFSFWILVLISFLIPFLILGMKEGFGGMDAWILMDHDRAFIKHGAELTVQGISEYPMARNGLIPETYTYVEWMKPLGMAVGLAMVKVGFYTTLGSMVALWFARQGIVLGLGAFIGIVYAYSAYFASPQWWNVFQIGPSLSVSVGNGMVSWKGALCGFALLILIFCVGCQWIVPRIDERE